MTYGSVGSLGSANSKASGTTVAITTGATVSVGDLIVVVTSWDNTDTADGDTTRLSCADSAGNTWTKIREYTTTDGVVADGVTLALFYSRLVNQLNSGGTITITSDTARIAKAATAWQFTTSSTQAVEQMAIAIGEGGTDPAALSLTGMPSREYLVILGFAHENVNSTTVGYNASYTAFTKDGTLGGTGAENIYVAGEFQIVTGTGESVNIDTSLDSNDHLQILVALYEDTAAPLTGVVSSPFGFERVTGGAPLVGAKARLTLPISFDVAIAYTGEILDNALHVVAADESVVMQRSVSLLLDGSQAQIAFFSEAPEYVPDLTGATIQLIPITPSAAVALTPPALDTRACIVRAWEVDQVLDKRRDGTAPTNLGQSCEGFFLHGENRLVVQAALTNFVVIAEQGSNWYITCEYTELAV
jgi:hypothetical protein